MMEHDQATELLGDLARGDLSGDEAEALRVHLAACDDCSLELRGLQALLHTDDDVGLTDVERARLEKGVAAKLAAANEEVIVPARDRSRLGTWLSAAALVGLLAIGLTQVDLDGGGDRSASDAAGTSENLDSGGGGAPVEVGGPDIAADRGTELEAAGEAAQSSEGSDEALSDQARSNEQVPARFDPDAGRFGTAQLKSYAATQPPFRTFANTYDPGDAEALVESYLDALAGAAPTGEGRSQIRTCALKVLEQDFPIVPAYGAYGRFQGRDALVLGFVYAPAESLDRYLVWVWPRGDCQTPLKIIAGRILR